MSGKWKSFWFEGGEAWGWIESDEDWRVIKESYPKTDLGTAKESQSYAKDTGKPYFGFRIECQGPGTLREFFDKHEMEL